MKKRVLVFSQWFEDYNLEDLNVKNAMYKFKHGHNFECIVPEDERIQNVVRSMYQYVTTQSQFNQNGIYEEFPVQWETLGEHDLTELEIQYKEYGDKYPLVKLLYDPETGTCTKI